MRGMSRGTASELPKAVFVGLVALLLCACVTTQELPLAPNVVRLDTEARGALFTNAVANVTLQRAAEATLQHGYSHFRLDNVDVNQSSSVTGYTLEQNYNLYNYGGMISGSSFGSVTPNYTRTASAGVTVIMFHASDPEARNAFDAQKVLDGFTKPQ